MDAVKFWLFKLPTVWGLTALIIVCLILEDFFDKSASRLVNVVNRLGDTL